MGFYLSISQISNHKMWGNFILKSFIKTNLVQIYPPSPTHTHSETPKLQFNNNLYQVVTQVLTPSIFSCIIKFTNSPKVHLVNP